MNKYVLNLGLNRVSKKHYGSNLPLQSAPDVARRLNSFFTDLGYDDFGDGAWIDKEVKSEFVQKRILHLQKKLVAGDTFVLSFCGHTKRVKETDSILRNYKNEDEGWALHDRVFFHFEIWNLAQGFKPGVKLILLSDSCFSGGLEGQGQIRKGKFERKETFWEKHSVCYNLILENSGLPMQHTVPPAVVVLSASSENGKTQQMLAPDRLTYFFEAFNQIEINREMTLSNFFDKLNHGLRALEIQEREDIKTSAQWHYYQGHAHTKLRTQSPPF